MELSGNTRFLSLFDVAQVLSVRGATGTLCVEHGERRACLYFQDGAIVNAMDAEQREGEDAARRVFAIRDAEFSFSADPASVTRRITCDARTLMLDVARRLDEEGEGDTTHQDEAKQATTRLSELFTRIDAVSRRLTHAAPQGVALGELLDAVRESPQALLLLRAGARPEVQVKGRTIPIHATRLDDESYRSLRDHLVRECHGSQDGAADPVAPDGGACTLRLGLNESYALDLLRTDDDELLTLRRLPIVDDLLATLPWPGEALDRLIAPNGSVVIVTAREGGALERAWNGVCAHVIRSGLSPFVGASRRWPPGLADGTTGAILLDPSRAGHQRRARDLIDRMNPAVVAVADSDAPGALSIALRAAGRGARVIVGLRAMNAAAAPGRWFDAVESGDRFSASLRLSSALTGILAVDGPPGRLGRIWPATEAARDALRRGDLDAVAREITGAGASPGR